jgi:ABC-2 type transport system ATP-binding protein
MSDLTTIHREVSAAPATGADLAVSVDRVRRAFDDKVALDGVSLHVPRGEIHALLGINGAGKTTLIRILTGLTAPDEGSVRLLGDREQDPSSRQLRSTIGLVPSGDRTFYLRISGIENLVFFARMHGVGRATALQLAQRCIDAVGLTDAATRPVGQYSHGMQKRLSFARAILTDPPLLLVDEATHDLDPQGALTIQALASESAARGTAVIWATQRLDEVRGFADRATVLHRGVVAFQGPVRDLLARTVTRRFIVGFGPSRVPGSTIEQGDAALGAMGRLHADADDATNAVLQVSDHVSLGAAIAALNAAGIDVVSCAEERSAMESAFLDLVEDPR